MKRQGRGVRRRQEVQVAQKTNAIQARMKVLGVRPSDLAESLGVTRQRVYQIVTGKDVWLHQATINKICKTLACDEDELFEERTFKVTKKVVRKHLN